MPSDNVAAAKAAGLRYVTRATPGIARRGRAGAFSYRSHDGRTVRDAKTLARIRALVLPPAWRDVWIAEDPLAHLQATGRDVAGRLQYRYHPLWTTVRDATKYHRMLAFAKALPHIRAQVLRDMAGKPLSRKRVLATVVLLLERTHIRIGNEEYLRANGSHGLTTLRDRHVEIRGRHLQFKFKAKSGVHQTIDLDDLRLARAVRQCQELPGQALFQHVDDSGTVRTVTSADVNEYLHAIGGEAFTAKDFRTWAGTLCAAQALDELGVSASRTAAAKAIVSAIDKVAAALGNTRAVCRKCYIHPAVLEAYGLGKTLQHVARPQRTAAAGLLPAEVALVALLQGMTRRRPTRAAA